MEFLGFVPPELLVDIYSTEPYQKGLSDMAGKFGGSRMDNRVAVIDVDSAPMPLPEYNRADAQRQTQGSGYATPQEAAAAYLKGLKAGDREQILSTFSVESYGEHYDLRAQAEFTRGYLFLRQDVSIPTVSEWAKAVVSLDRKMRLKREILSQARAFYLCSTYFSGIQANQEDIAFGWEELPGKVELDTLELLGCLSLENVCEICGLPPVPESQNARKAAICGASQVDASVLIFQCGSETYALFLEEAEYDGKWYNSQIGNAVSTMLGLSTEFKGTAPAELIGAPAELKELLIPVEIWMEPL